MHHLFIGIKDTLPSIRSSSLSNIAELCKLMGFSLHPFIRDILSTVESILRYEKEEEVRRGLTYY